MQVDQLSTYLSQLMHTTDTTEASAGSDYNSNTAVNGTDINSFDKTLNTYINTDEDSTSALMTSYKDLMGLMSGSSYTSGTSESLVSSIIKDDNRTPLEVAQDAYSEFLSLAADALSGVAENSDESNILDNETDNSLSDLSDAINNLSTIINGTSDD